MPRYYFGHHKDNVTSGVVVLEQRNVKVRLPAFIPVRNSAGIYNTAFRMKSNTLYNEIKTRLMERSNGRYTVTESLGHKLTSPLRVNIRRKAMDYNISNNDYKYLIIEPTSSHPDGVSISNSIFIHFLCHKFYKDDAIVSVVVTTEDITNKRGYYNNYVPGCEYENSSYFFRAVETDTGIDIGSIISIVSTYYDKISDISNEYTKDLKKNKLALVRVHSVIDSMCKRFIDDPTREETSPNELLSYYGITYKKRYNNYDYGIIVKAVEDDRIVSHIDLTVFYTDRSKAYHNANMLFKIHITETNLNEISNAIDNITRSTETIIKLLKAT